MNQVDTEKYYLIEFGLESIRAVFDKNYDINEFDKRIEDIKLKYNINSDETWEKIKNLNFDNYTWR